MGYIILVGLIFWVVCGVLAYGITYGHFERQYPTVRDLCREGDKNLAMFMAAAGPFGLVVSLIGSDCAKHGLKYW